MIATLLRTVCLLVALSAAALPAQAAQTDWVVLTRMQRIDPSIYMGLEGLAYDLHRERLILVRGDYGSRNSGASVWEWDGVRWEGRPVARGPALTGGRCLAYDAARRQTVLFDDAGATWLWDGHAWTRGTPQVSPPRRSMGSMVYDAARQRVVLFGGALTAGTLATDVWEWDGASWHRSSPTLHPPGRAAFGMAYDSVRQRTVVYGGWTSSSPDAAVWEWDGVRWTSTLPATRPTGGNWTESMCYDPARQRCVFVSSDRGTWAWDGAAWQSLSSVRRGFGFVAHDVARDESLWFFGNGLDALQGVAWQRRWAAETAGQLAGGARMAVDPSRGRVVAFGGSWGNSVDGYIAVARTHEWDGVHWQELTPQNAPSARFGHGVFHDPNRQQVLLFGGSKRDTSWGGSGKTTWHDDTWAWDGNDWSRLQPARRPSARHGHAIATDPLRGRGVLFGGADQTSLFDDTWEWDGLTWLSISTATRPPARTDHGMAYDAVRGVVVLFGGVDSSGTELADTWEWNGVAWRRAVSTASPPARSRHAMAWDAARQRIVVHGGNSSWQPHRDTWEWDGSNWQQLLTSASPPPANEHGTALAFDPTRRALIEAPNLAGSWLLGSFVRGTSSISGTGCGGPGGVPMLACTEPRLGNQSFQLEVGPVVGGTPCVVAMSTIRQPTRLPGGCTFYLGGAVVTIASTANRHGGAVVRLPVSSDPSLQGLALHAQASAVDPQGPLGGHSLTPLLSVVLGDS